MSEHVPTFDIFRGRFNEERKVYWLESVEGLASANRRMQELSTQEPGPYFIFSVWNRTVVAQVDTTPQATKQAACAA
jgi:hypothetical protein